MHSKWRYKIWICSVILGEPESFEITLHESKNFTDSSLYPIFESENLIGVLLFTKNSLTWGVKCEKLNL